MAENTQMIRIGDKYFDGTKLTDTAMALISDIEKIDGEIGKLQLHVSIMNLAKTSLIEKLVIESVNLVEVPAPEQK